jgi:hypothetical protein
MVKGIVLRDLRSVVREKRGERRKKWEGYESDVGRTRNKRDSHNKPDRDFGRLVASTVNTCKRIVFSKRKL